MESTGNRRGGPDRTPVPLDGNADSSDGRSNADTPSQNCDRLEADRVKRLELLKTAIARGEYRVPAAAVADAILAFHWGGPASAVPLRPPSRRLRSR